ncbi:MAG: hypothetical protein QOI63_243 [Thermoplasmata archaeon]|jgi:uncharacterized protein (DUF1697 family)|nr:hypothetical protein [Thermoplasmata archaeon]
MTTFVALLRAVNVGGRKVAMADLRKLVEGLGFADVQTYIQSGNLVLTGKGTAAAVEAKLEKAIAAEFGIAVPVIARTAEQWKAYLSVPKPFVAAAQATPNWVVLGLSKQPPAKGAAASLVARAQAGERVDIVGDAVWFHYPQGIGESKLTPASIDKAVGSPLTARNLNTVRKLAQMAGTSA